MSFEDEFADVTDDESVQLNNDDRRDDDINVSMLYEDVEEEIEAATVNEEESGSFRSLSESKNESESSSLSGDEETVPPSADKENQPLENSDIVPPPSSSNDNNSQRKRSLQSLLAEQEKYLPTSQLPCDLGRGKRRKRTHSSLKAKKPRTREEAWNEMITAIILMEPDFFSSDEALLRNRSKLERGRQVYKGLKANEENCEDLMTIYNIRFRSSEVLSGKPQAQYANVRCMAGQIMRFSIACGLLAKEDGWKKGAPSTVATKANTLSLLVRYASSSFTDQEALNNLARVSDYLGKTASSAKKKHVTITRQRNAIDYVTKEDALLQPSDMTHALRLASNVLKDIFKTYCQDKAKKKSFAKRLHKQEGLLEKWGINFLAAIVFAAGGQRPEAIARIEVPTDLELKSSKPTQFGSFFSLRVRREKVERDAAFPVIIVPVMLQKFVKFYVNFIRRFIIRKSKIEKQNEPWSLLLHTKDGRELSARCVSRSLRSFMRRIDKKFEYVTGRVVRYSFATMMIQSYRNGKLGKDIPEDVFLDHLGRRMNTKPQQLKEAYLRIRRVDFEEGCKIAMEHFFTMMNEGMD